MINFTIDQTEISFFNGQYKSLLNYLNERIKQEKDPFIINELKKELEQIEKIEDVRSSVLKKPADKSASFISFCKIPIINSDNSTEIIFVGVDDGNHNNIDNNIVNKTAALDLLESIQEYIHEYIDDFIILDWNKQFILDVYPDKLYNKYFKYQAKSIEGESFLFGLAVAFISNIFDMQVQTNYFFSGSFDKNLRAKKVGGLEEKFNFIINEQPINPKIFVPINSTYKKSKGIDVIEIEDFNDLILKVFSMPLEKIVVDNLDRLKKLSMNNSILELIPKGKLEIELLRESNLTDGIIIKSEIQKLTSLHLKFSLKPHQVFPLPKKLTTLLQKGYDLIVLEGRVTTFYAGYITTINAQLKAYFAVKIGSDENSKAIIYHSHHTKPNYTGMKFIFNKYF